MLKLAKKHESKLNCICGLCDHDCMDKACPFNKIMDDLHPEAAQKKAILTLMNDVVKDAIAATGKTSSKTQKTTRAKINTKKGK